MVDEAHRLKNNQSKVSSSLVRKVDGWMDVDFSLLVVYFIQQLSLGFTVAVEIRPSCKLFLLELTRQFNLCLDILLCFATYFQM